MKCHTLNRMLRYLTGAFIGLVALAAIAADPPPSAPSPTANRKIQPNDVIFIRVVGEADLTMDRRVGADGKITYPYLDEIVVKDKSLTEVERMIRDGLKDDYIINPQVTVDFKEYVKDYVNVSGMVGMPGRIELPIDRRLDILDVLSLARDLTPRANPDKIELRRAGKEVQVFKMKALRAINDPDKKIYIEPGDTIHVQEAVF